MRRPNARWVGLFVAIAVVWLFQPASLFAQAAALKPETLVGKYQGAASTPDGSSMPLRVELRLEKGAIVGAGDSPQGTFVISATTITDDKVVMTMLMDGMTGTLSGVMKGARVEGTWTLQDMAGTYVLEKLSEAGATPPADEKPAAPAAKPASDPLTGTWDGVTGQGDQTIGFALILKLDGEKVTGEVSSEQGGAPLSSGTWKDGTLNVSFDYGGMGLITMVAAIKEGKLVGTMDLAGQMQMPWAAVKRGS